MARGGRRDLPRGIARKMCAKNGRQEPAVNRDGAPLYRVRVWDPIVKKQVVRVVAGLDAAKELLEEYAETKNRRPGQLRPQRVGSSTCQHGTSWPTRSSEILSRPRSSVARNATCSRLPAPVLGSAWIDLDLRIQSSHQRLTLQDGRQASGGTKSTAAAVLRRVFVWAREERVIPVNPALELRTGWGASLRRRVVIPSIPQVLRLADAMDHFKLGLGDVVVVLAFTGLRWEEAVAVPIENVNLDSQWIRIDRTASESGGKRDIRDDLKTRAAERVVAIPDIAMPAVRRLVQRGEAGREASGGALYSRLINGERGGYLGYGMWRKYLRLAHGYTASHPDGMVSYTAHELRHVCASLLIASGASDMQVAAQMGHRRIETTKNIYGHLFAHDRQELLDALNAAVSRLYANEQDEAA